MELNDVFGADKFGSAGWVGDGCEQEEPNPSGSPAGREIHPEGAPGADKWGAVGFIAIPNAPQWDWRCRMQRDTGMLEGCVALAGHSTAPLNLSSVFGVERTPNVPVWSSKGVQHLSWDLLLLLACISQGNNTTWSGVAVLRERVGLDEVHGVFQGLTAPN